jgi:ATP-binding cassette, subfamily F, member 3
MRAKDVLLDALMDYTGTVVFVSHDRYFIDKLATRVFEIGDGKVEIFPGNYEDYLWRKQGGQLAVPTLDDVPSHVSQKRRDMGHPTSPTNTAGGAPLLADVARSGLESSSPTNGNNGTSPPAESPKKRLNPIKRKQMEDRVQKLEQEIGRAEDAITRLEAELQDFVSAEESQRQSQELDQHKASHASMVEEWEGLSETLQQTE